MGLEQDIPLLIDHWKNNKDIFEHNEILFNIFEGDLLTYVLEDLKKQLKAKSFESAKHRVAPINVLKRLIDKLSKIYAKPPTRTIENGNDADLKLVAEYVKEMDLNTELGGSSGANGFFNLFKNTWVEPYMDEEDGCPKVRIIPSGRFFVYSKNRVNPTRPTHFVKIMGTHKTAAGTYRTVFYGYTAEEFLIFDDEGKVLTQMMVDSGADGSNPYGALPGVYINRSRHSLIPRIDSDTMSMTRLIPVLLTDLNFALMFQCFSVVYTIDVDQSGLTMGPDALWDLKSDNASDKDPQVGTIKPSVDSDKALGMIKALFSLWMQTRNIKPGAMGELTVENAASGIAKAIDEMDTSEDRQSQVPYFVNAEMDLFKLILTKMHPVWSQSQNFKFKGRTFSASAKVVTAFAEQRPNVDPGVAVDNQVKKLGAKLQDRLGALMELHPDWSKQQAEDRLAEIDKSLGIGQEGVGGVNPATTGGDVKDVSKEVLNGAQSQSLVDIVDAVASGRIPRDAGAQIISLSYKVSPEEALKILGTAGDGFKPTAEPKPTFGGGFPPKKAAVGA